MHAARNFSLGQRLMLILKLRNRLRSELQDSLPEWNGMEWNELLQWNPKMEAALLATPCLQEQNANKITERAFRCLLKSAEDGSRTSLSIKELIALHKQGLVADISLGAI